MKRIRIKSFPWSLGLAVGLIIFFTPHPEWHGDLLAFRSASDTLRHPYYARWLFWLLTLPSEPVAFVMLSLASTASMVFAVGVFGGKHWMVFASFAYAWTIYYGQIDGIVAGGLALAWWAIQKERPYWLGAGLTIASLKPQLSLPIIFLFWWWSPNRWKSLAVPLVVFCLSLVQWGWWVPEWILRLPETPDLVNLSRNLSLWPEIGPSILLIWPLIALLPLEKPRKIIAVMAGTALSMPYFPLPSSILFLSMTVPWWIYVTLQIPLLGSWLGYWIYWGMKIVPPLLLVWSAWPWISEKVQPRQKKQGEWEA